MAKNVKIPPQRQVSRRHRPDVFDPGIASRPAKRVSDPKIKFSADLTRVGAPNPPPRTGPHPQDRSKKTGPKP